MFYALQLNTSIKEKVEEPKFDPLTTIIFVKGKAYTKDLIFINSLNKLVSKIPIEIINSNSYSSYFVAWKLASNNLPFYVYVLPETRTSTVVYYKLSISNQTIAYSIRTLPTGLNIRAKILSSQLRLIDYTNHRDITDAFFIDRESLNNININDLDDQALTYTIEVIQFEDLLYNLYRTLTTGYDITFIVLPEQLDAEQIPIMDDWLNKLYYEYKEVYGSGFVVYASHHYPEVNQKEYLFALRRLDNDSLTYEVFQFNYLPYFRDKDILLSYIYYALLLQARLQQKTLTVDHVDFKYLIDPNTNTTQLIAEDVLTDYLYTHKHKFYQEYFIAGISILKKILRVYLLRALHSLSINKVLDELNAFVNDINLYLKEIVQDFQILNIEHVEVLGLVYIELLFTFNIYNRIINVKLFVHIDRDKLTISV
jgi:hypothetical protein